MADQRSAMKEFRLLDRKRAGEGLTPAEEERYAQLRDLVQPELAAGPVKGGFDVDAAAARLRESLQPAGARARPAPPAAPPAATPAEALPAGDALASSLEAELFGPDASAAQPDAFGDLGPLDAVAPGAGDSDPAPGWSAAAEGELAGYGGDAEPTAEAGWAPEGAPAEVAQAHDPGEAGYEAAQTWDADAADGATQPYDPNAAPYDPSQPYDPGAPGYDASQPYDPDAAPYDASQPYDPNAAPYDASQPYDPNAAPYDASQPYDPNAAPYDASQPYDPDAPAHDPSQPYDPSAAPYDASQPYDPSAAPYDASQPFDPGAQPHDASASFDSTASPDGAPGPGDLAPEGAEWTGSELLDTTSLPTEAPDAAAWEPGALADGSEPLGASGEGFTAAAEIEPAEGWEATTAQPLAEPGDPLAAAQELLADVPDAGPIPVAPLDADVALLPPAGWDGDPAPAASAPADAGAFGEYDEGGAPGRGAPLLAEETGDDAGLASMLPFDAAAAAALAPGEMPEGFAPAMGEYDDTAGFGRVVPDLAPLELPSDASGFHAAQAVATDGALPSDDALDDPFRLASGGSFDASADAAAPEWAGAAPTPPWDEATPSADADAAPPGADGEPPFEAQLADALDATAQFGAPGAEGEASHEAPLADAPDAADPFHVPGAEGEPPFEAQLADALDATAQFGAPGTAAELDAPDATGGLAPEQGERLEIPDPADAPEPTAQLEIPDPAAAPEPTAQLAIPDPTDLLPDAQAVAADPGAGAAGAAAIDDFEIDVDLGDAEDLPAEPPAPVPEPPPRDAAPELPAPLDAEPGVELAPQLPPDLGDDLSAELAPEIPPAEPPGALDFSRPDFSEGRDGEEDWPAVGGGGPPPDRAPVLPQLELADAPASEEIPTLEGEEILEELPDGKPPRGLAPAPPAGAAAPPASDASEPPAAAPPALPAAAVAAPTPAPEAAPRAVVPVELPGVHRVVVHTVEGQVRRGVLEDPDLGAPTLALLPQPGAAAEALHAEKVKAIFFMLSPGEHVPPAEGRKVRVTFKDGRQVAGFSPDYSESGPGFFMLPGDTRTNTARIWVYRAAARTISVT